MRLIKLIKSEIIPSLTCILNQSLHTGIFPDTLKIAKIIPIYKKGSLNDILNYRPISLLPSISKNFEKLIFIQLSTYLNEHKLLHDSQYGFREGHSTELASIELIDRITQDLDKGKIPISIFLDLSKAFDTLDHAILLQKLNHYGIRSVELKLLTNYLRGRTQYVAYDKATSDIYPITTGVPQGSILGPLLFIIYINDICNASKLFKMIIYADDTTLYSTLDVFGTFTTKEINLEITKITDWLKLTKLSINIKKSKFMVFHMPQKQVNLPKIKIENIEVECADEFIFSGLIIHKHLKWDSHITKIATKIRNIIGIIYRIKHMVPLNILLTIYNALIKPHICLKCWGFNQERIFKLQKKAMRIICSSGYLSHSEPLFFKLNVLKIDGMFTHQVLNFCYDLINKNLPAYFNNMSSLLQTITYHHNIRQRKKLSLPLVKHVFARKCMRFCIPDILNKTSNKMTVKIKTHSRKGFTAYIKLFLINKYDPICSTPNCYICSLDY